MSVTINGTTGISSPSIDLAAALSVASGGTGSTSETSALNVLNAIVDLSSATADYDLAIGQRALINYTDMSTVPLHVVAGDGRMFRLSLTGTNVNGDGSVYLLPNNTVYGNVFTQRVLYGRDVTALSGAAANNPPVISISGNCFALDGIVLTDTLRKYAEFTSSGSTTVYSYHGYRVFQWQDTTTVWSSLGTIVFSSVTPVSVAGDVPRTGKIIIERIA